MSEVPQRDKSRLERLSEKLYSRTRYKAPEDLREPITPTEGEQAPVSWQSPQIDELLTSDRRKPEQYPLMRKIFTVALLFFICAGAAAALIYFKGDNFVSSKNLDISIEGPASIAAGAPIDLDITITNKNNADLDNVVMNIMYPEGTRDAADTTLPVTHAKETVDSLTAGDRISKTEKVVFLGAEGEVKSIRVSVTYRVKGSNAVFTKEKAFDLTIGSAPVSVSVTRPESVTSGDPFTATIAIVSNSSEVIRNAILRAEFPYGFSLSGASPPISDLSKGIWLLGDLSPGDKKTITLYGTLNGEDNEERTFRFFVGVGKAGSSALDTLLSSDSIAISINKPSLGLSVKLNGDPSLEYAAPPGKPVQASITVRNNLAASLLNPEIQVRLSGALDRLSVIPQNGGFYNSANTSVTWNRANDDELGPLGPGDSKTVSVNFAAPAGLQPAQNQKIDLVMTFTGRPQDGTANIVVTERRTVKISSEVTFTARSLYSRGPFQNTGSIPPKADSITIYTIDMILGNTQNDIVGSKVTGILGANVEWLGEVSPSGTAVSYDAATRTVTWDVGTLPSGAGFSSAGKEAFFRVALKPSLGQVGGVPVLLGNIVFTGTDSFANLPLRIAKEAITTKIASDPKYVQGDEIVVK